MDKLDIPDKNTAKTVPAALKHRRSFFGYDSIDSKEEKNYREEYESHINKLEVEFKEWPQLYTQQKTMFFDYWKKEAEESNYGTKMTKEQQEYLMKAVNVDDYIQNYNKLSRKIQDYILRKEWLREKCRYCFELIQEKMIEDVLSSKIYNDCN